MSLINKMLQDLEQRRADATVGGAFADQVRVASAAPGGIHAAWWCALGLAAVLAGVMAWFWLGQRAPVAVTAAVPPPVPLTLPPAPALAMPSPRDPAQDILMAEPPAAVPVMVADAPVTAPIAKTRSNNRVEAPEEETAEPAISALPPKGRITAPSAMYSGPATGINKQITQPTAPQRAENEYREAVLLVQQGRVAAAIPGLERALQLDPQYTAARQTLIGALLESRRRDEAVSRLTEGLGLDASQSGLAMILARLQMENGELAPALATLQHSLPYAADQAEYQAFLAALLQRDKRHREAIDHYWVAVRKVPQNGVWWMGMGISLEAENRLPEAREAFGLAKTSNTLSSELQAFVVNKLKQLKP